MEWKGKLAGGLGHKDPYKKLGIDPPPFRDRDKIDKEKEDSFFFFFPFFSLVELFFFQSLLVGSSLTFCVFFLLSGIMPATSVEEVEEWNAAIEGLFGLGI